MAATGIAYSPCTVLHTRLVPYMGLLETSRAARTSARAISVSSAIRREAHCGACAGAHPWCDPSGIKQNCHYKMQDLIDRVYATMRVV